MRENKVHGIIFSNMHDHALSELTEKRTMGSIPIGGRYRLIDFILSNMVNSGISDIGVVTKSNYQSLMDHLGSGREWDLARKKGGISILPPFGHAGSGIYRGKLEALHGILGYIRHSQAQYFVLADCDVIANINLKKAIDQHMETGADVTILYKKDYVVPDAVQECTVFEIDDTGRVTDVLINPQTSGECNINLNMYIISKDLLERIITDTSSRNLYSFRKDFLQASAGKLWFQGFEVTEEARKINCMKSFYEANMDMLNEDLRDSLFPKDRPIYTKVRDEVPTMYGLGARVSNSLVADGCVIEGEVENSIIFRGVTIGKEAKVKNSIVMQGTTVGEKANLDYVIIDKDVTVSDNRMLMGFSTYPIFISKGSIV
ncbi:glucose-1-phosphate adenylyltransferase subunit GlgD [Zongyangia hominis]|uniref:Glucose-1-phosphate adenylyltransferase subunit GlgD n=1 Tax=Zongyangia hominis TaxID=2763677 RepID=A0A926ICB4_9FIRM|nr:glucose-1-phosphate adenylyltransferase subunit GlgD [Zongyangia hominis]MBC8571037.1 glucose-1-phosphate adenylyltransferase subunit GlgD [Zongyangia hominis]